MKSQQEGGQSQIQFDPRNNHSNNNNSNYYINNNNNNNNNNINNNTIASMLRNKLNKNQKIDINQIKQYYDIQSHNVSYQYTASNPIGPKQLNNQAQKPGYNESNSFSSPAKTELSETPQMMRKSKKVVFNESQISQIIPIDQQQINYLKRNFINENSNSKQEQEQDQNIKVINQEFEKSQRQLDDDPIQIEAISQSVTPVKINRNHINNKEELFSYRKSGNVTILSTNQSLCDEQILEEIRNWEKVFDVDKTVLGKVETTFKDMEDRISDLEAQFEICYHLTGKMEQKYQDLHKLLKGAPVFKVSRRNKKKANLRLFFYSPSLEAFCWKCPKDNFPEKKQLVYIKNIKEVHTRLDAARKLPTPFTDQQYIRIVMMDKKEPDLELICEDTSLRTILLKVISSLIEDIRKSQHIKSTNINQNNNNNNNDHNLNTPSLINTAANCEFLISKYSKDIQNIKDQIANTKGYFGDSTQHLRNTFFQATQSLVQKERSKRKQIIQQQKQELIQKKKEQEEQHLKAQSAIQIEKEDYDSIAYQNLELKQEISDLEYEKQGFMERLEQQEQCIQQMIISMNESINKLCQAPPVQDLQQYFYQIDYTQPIDSFYNNQQQSDINSQQYAEGALEDQYKSNQQQQQQQHQTQTYLYQTQQMKSILSQCVDKILQEYFGLLECQSNYQRHTTASDKLNSPSQNDYMNIRRTIIDKEEEIKKVKNYSNEMNDKYQILLVEYNKSINEKKTLLDKNEEIQRINKYSEIENVEIKQENTELKQQIENLLTEISSKEDNFTCIVEGLQLMRDEILDQADLLQEEVKNQQMQIEQLQKSSQPSALKTNYLENKVKEKDNQIKQLIEQIDKLQLSESRNKTNQSICSESDHSIKVNNQLLLQESSQLKCQLQSMNNKNQYLEKLVLQLQQQQQQTQHQQQQQQQFNSNNHQSSNKENVHPNVLSSELSFKVRHERNPSQNSLQFQSKQFNLLNQRNVELQSQLDASSALVKELEQKIVSRDSYRTSKKPSEDFQSAIKSHQSYSSSQSNLNQNKNIYDYSQQKQILHQKNMSLKQFPNNDFITYTLSPNNRLNNKF